MKMTIFKYSVLIFIGIIVASCTKHEEEIFYDWSCNDFYQYKWSHSSALTNYSDWDVFVMMGILTNEKLSLSFWNVLDTINYCEPIERIRVSNLPVSRGTVALEYTTVSDRLFPHDIPTANFNTHAGGIDTVSERYNLRKDGKASEVTITFIAPDTSEIRGTYNLYFEYDATGPSKSDPNRPDTLEFIHGSFRAFRN